MNKNSFCPFLSYLHVAFEECMKSLTYLASFQAVSDGKADTH